MSESVAHSQPDPQRREDFSMHSRRASHASLLGFLPLLLPVVLTGQRAQEIVVPLRNWAAPLYWQPNQAEREASFGVTPRISFSTNQVSTGALTFVAISPCRLVDTRGAGADFNGISPFSGPSLGPSTTTTFPVQSAAEAAANTTPTPCGTIPSIAQAYSFNITAIPKTAGGIAFVTVWPSGAPQPGVSTINDGEGVILANAAIVPAGTPSGGVNVLNSGPATMDLTIDMNGFYAAPSDLNGNTAVGSGALVSNTTGSTNTAIGTMALNVNNTGMQNTATGYRALQNNANGSNNTAIGNQALQGNTSGAGNTATGDDALQINSSGAGNTADGVAALANNDTGSGSTAVGFAALDFSVATGTAANTAVGYQALLGNVNMSGNTGVYNSALGYQALQSNTSGFLNTAMGFQALQFNTIGSYNTAVGNNTLAGTTTGTNNIAIGYSAGSSIGTSSCPGVVSCSYNIDIGNNGVAEDQFTIRIGSGQSATYIAGISDFDLGASGTSPVVINSQGQLGINLSSRRYKEDIQSMGDSSRGLMDLRPVTFRYKKPALDGSKPQQYGLIAEEVADVYPDLVVYKDGQPNAVQYQLLPAMLLNEVQRQQAEIGAQKEQFQKLAQQVTEQRQQNESLQERLAKLEAGMGSTPSVARASGGH
jgi:hypothetical protein